jgi:hypothetical protein
MRVLFVIDGSNIGGAERITVALLPRLKRSGAFVAVFIPPAQDMSNNRLLFEETCGPRE